MNTEKLQQIDELLTQIAEDAISLASDVAKLKTKREQIELQLQSITEQQEVTEFFPKLHDYGVFTDGVGCKLDANWKDFIRSQNANYMTRATPELAKHDAIALHNYARLLAYRAEHWPDFVISDHTRNCWDAPVEAGATLDTRGTVCVPAICLLGYQDTILFPTEAKTQLQQALDNGLLVQHKQPS